MRSISLCCTFSRAFIITIRNADTPIFLGHGEFDPVIDIGAGKATRDALLESGHDVSWKSYPMEHAVSPAEIEDVAKFLRRVLP